MSASGPFRSWSSTGNGFSPTSQAGACFSTNCMHVWGFLADRLFLLYNQELLQGAECRLDEEFSS